MTASGEGEKERREKKVGSSKTTAAGLGFPFSHALSSPSIHSPPGAPGPGAALLARILQYQETPQYLRRRLIPVHPDLRAAGALPPLDAPHHARAGEWVAWRDGCVLASAVGAGSVVDVGLDVVS